MLRFLTVFLFVIVGISQINAQCCTNCPVELPDVDATGSNSGDIVMTVTGAANNDLSDPAQGVCEVILHFTHEYIGDETIWLLSPAGQSVLLIGPEGYFGDTEGATWDISFVPCSSTAVPDPGFSASFDNSNNWDPTGAYTGSYYPSTGCLEDFNTGPINGEWTIHWNDGQAIDVGEFFDYNVIFCDNVGVECYTCASEGGTITPTASVNNCFGDPNLDLGLSPIFTGGEIAASPAAEYNYVYLIIRNDTLVAYSTDSDLTNTPPGTYTVCGLSYSIGDVAYLPAIGTVYSDFATEMNSTHPPFCGNLSNNCIDVFIGIPVDVSVGFPDTITCANPSVNIVGSSTVSNVNYTWLDPNNVSHVGTDWDASIPGEYIFTVSDGSGLCPAHDTIQVIANVEAPGVVFTTNTITCLSPTVDILATGGNTDYSYAWVYPDGTLSSDETLLDVDGAGNYAVHVIDETNGCFIDEIIPVAIDTMKPEDVTLSGENVINCYHDAGVLASSSTPGVSYEWNGPDADKVLQPVLPIDVPGTYELKVIGENGCIFETTWVVTIDTVTPLIAPVTLDTIDCFNPTASLTGGTTTGVDYDWYDSNGILQGSGNPYMATGPGSYHLICTNLDNGCVAEDNVLVEGDLEEPVISLAIDGVEDCYGEPVSVHIISERPIDNTTWTGSGTISVQTLDSVLIDDSGNYHVSIVGENGCVGENDFFVGVDTVAPTVAGTSKFDVTCINDEGYLSISGSSEGDNFRYHWAPIGTGEILFDENSVLPYVKGAGIYLLTVFDTINGCSASNEVLLDEILDVPRDIVYDSIAVGCYGAVDGIISIDAVDGGIPPYLYSLDGSAFGTTKIFSPLEGGEHTIIVQDVNGCETERIVTVDEPHPILLDLGPDQLIQLGTGVTVTGEISDPSLIESFVWNEVFDSACVGSLDCFTQDFYPQHSVTLMATAIDIYGCKVTDKMEITVDDTPNVYAPNIFTPNGDGSNDLFTVFYGQGVEEVIDLRVYDRWGGLMYSVPVVEANNGWDGFLRGQLVPSAVYIYEYTVQMQNGATRFYKGDVTLIR